MILVLLYVLVIFFGLIIPCLIVLFALFEIRSGFLGAPYVPISGKIVEEILRSARLQKGGIFMELGSGDGRIVRFAVKNYGVRGVGIEANPLLVFYSTLLAYFQNLREIKFKRQNFFDADLKTADTLFLFLMPRTLQKLTPKLKKECKKSLIISHGFKIEGWDRYLVGKQNRKLFPTYFYRL